MDKTNLKKTLMVVLPIVLALISIFALAKPLSSTKFHAKTIESLDDKQETVMKLTAASTAASALISAIPTDAGTPIAEKIADLSSYFLIVLCAIFLEKYLVTITGYATFAILIPLACALFAANVYFHKEVINRLVAKILLFGLALFAVIPMSVAVSNMIESTYEESINETITNAQEMTSEISEDAKEDEDDLWGKITSTVKNTVSDASSKLEGMFNNFMEALAVMIVTSCVIPILVLLFLVWIVKIILGVDINMPSMPRRKHHSHPSVGIAEK